MLRIERRVSACLRRGSRIAAVLTLCATASSAQLVELRNDSVEDFSQVAILTGFVADERAAVWLTSTCDGSLTALRYLWLSVLGGQPDVLHQAIDVYEAGSFPTPGTRRLEMLGPLMQDGGFNEFQLTSPLPVAQGETFVVDFQMLNPPPGLGPSLVTDVDGCQPGRNAVFAIPGGWSDLCSFGASGDWAIRAVVDCAPLFSDGFESGDTGNWSTAVP
jgi:hypothetical protein